MKRTSAGSKETEAARCSQETNFRCSPATAASKVLKRSQLRGRSEIN